MADLQDGVRQIRSPNGWLSLYRWRPGVWYACTRGRVVALLSGADVGIAQTDDMIRNFPRCRSDWRLQYSTEAGVPLDMYSTPVGYAVAVVSTEAGRVRVETLAPSEDIAGARTVEKAQFLRRVCAQAQDPMPVAHA